MDKDDSYFYLFLQLIIYLINIISVITYACIFTLKYMSLLNIIHTSQALCADSILSNSIKAKPLGSPVDLYRGMLTYNTLPQWEKIFFIHSWSTLCGRHSWYKNKKVITGLIWRTNFSLNWKFFFLIQWFPQKEWWFH